MRGRSELGRRALLQVLAASGLWVALPSAAAPVDAASDASGQVSLELAVLYGVKDGKGVVPAGFAELREEPWTKFDHYEILTQRRIVLAPGSVKVEALPDGWSLESTLVEATPPKVQLVLRDAKGARHMSGKYSASSGVRFLPAAYPYKSGRAVIALKLI